MASKEFITYTPNIGSGNASISVTASNNTGEARSTSLNISGGGISKSISISQDKTPNIDLSKVTFIFGCGPYAQGNFINEFQQFRGVVKVIAVNGSEVVTTLVENPSITVSRWEYNYVFKTTVNSNSVTIPSTCTGIEVVYNINLQGIKRNGTLVTTNELGVHYYGNDQDLSDSRQVNCTNGMFVTNNSQYKFAFNLDRLREILNGSSELTLAIKIVDMNAD